MSSPSMATLIQRRVSSEETPSAHAEMDYFRSRLRLPEIRDWLRQEKEKGRKVFGLMCWSVPVEMVLASGGVPVRLSGVSENDAHRGWNFPRDLCPLTASCVTDVQALTREALLDAVVLPGTCDWKRKIPDLLGGVKVLTLGDPSSGSLRFADADLKRLAKEVALITDIPVVTRNLARASERVAKANEAYLALQHIRRRPRSALSGQDALAIEQAFLRDDVARWTEHCRYLVQSLKGESPAPEQRPGDRPARILLIGSPVVWKPRSVVHLIEEAGGQVVCEDFHSRLALLYPAEPFARAAGTNGSSLARRWSRTCFCSCAAEEDDGLVFRAIHDFAVEGLIGHVYRTCARTQMRLPGILRRARDNGISTLALETEGTASEADRLRARIEPFVEMLLSKRRNGA